MPYQIYRFTGDRRILEENAEAIAKYISKKDNDHNGAIHAIKGISLEVNDGEIVALIGSNGAGKSTTLRTISGLMKPKTGRIMYDGEDITGVPAHKIVGKGLCQVPEGRHVCVQCVERFSAYSAKTVIPTTVKKRRKELQEAAKELKDSFLDWDLKTFD